MEEIGKIYFFVGTYMHLNVSFYSGMQLLSGLGTSWLTTVQYAETILWISVSTCRENMCVCALQVL